MLRKLVICLIITCSLVFASVTTAQQDKTPLTNDDVIKLLKVKLPESTIVTVIQVSPTNFDTSREAIEKLQKEGATEKIIEAMLAELLKSAETKQMESTADGVRFSRLRPEPPFIRPFNIRSIVRNALNFEMKTCERGLRTIEDCQRTYETGCRNSNRPYDPYLNVLKNQMPPPDLEPRRTLNKDFFDRVEPQAPAGLGEKNHADFAAELARLGEGEIVTLIGYLIDVKVMEKETCNCQMDYDEEEPVDFHMWIGLDAKPADDYLSKRINKKTLEKENKKLSVVVEMSPYYRLTHYKNRWTHTRANSVVARQVKVVGMLLMDNEHNNARENCGFRSADKKNCWRLSAWEIHPVTQFYVCEGSQKCSANSPNWKPL